MVETVDVDELKLLVHSEMLARRMLRIFDITYDQSACAADIVWTLRDDGPLRGKSGLTTLHMNRYSLAITDGTFESAWRLCIVKADIQARLEDKRQTRKKTLQEFPAPRYDEVFYRGTDRLNRHG